MKDMSTKSQNIDTSEKRVQAIDKSIHEPWDTADMAHRPNGLTIDDDDIQEYKRPWVGLTDEERNKLWKDVIGWGDPSHDEEDLMKAIEAALRKKNDPSSN